MRNGTWSRRLKAVVAACGSLALIGVSGTGFADDNGSVPVDIATVERIFEQILGLKIPGVDSHSVGIDPVGHKIGVTIFAPKGVPAVTTGRLKFGDNVTVRVVESEGPRPQANVAAGENYHLGLSNGSTGNCTAGFAVGLKGGQSGFLTSGHCFEYYKPPEKQQVLVGKHELLATGYKKVYGPSDWGVFVLYGSPDIDDALPDVVNANGNLPVKGIAIPTDDMRVCKHGKTTGATCGTVVAQDLIVLYPKELNPDGTVFRPERKVRGLVEMDACVEGGDSGGPVYAHTPDDKALAVGITSGASTDKTGRCLETVGKPNVSYFVPLAAMLPKGSDTSAEYFLKLAK